MKHSVGPGLAEKLVAEPLKLVFTVVMLNTTSADGRVVRGERNRQAIADAMLAFYDEGELRPSAAQVAKRAGISARSVHNHFADMESLRAEVAQRQWARFS